MKCDKCECLAFCEKTKDNLKEERLILQHKLQWIDDLISRVNDIMDVCKHQQKQD